jgi:peptidoglycan biosynthesis protein MviN/MurJ (putative lipid II flippase)
MNSPQPYLTVASILTGFCISVFMFRIQRELRVRDRHPDWPNWLAWADYLIVATIVLSVVLVILPLVAMPTPSHAIYSVAAGACAAASLLLLAYPFAILDHYRIEIGARRGEEPQARHKGEPIERIIVITAGIVAAMTFAAIVFVWNR